MGQTFTAHDREILRRLAGQIAELAEDSRNAERRDAWYRLDAAAPDRRPMVLAEFGGIADKNKPLPDDLCRCSEADARGLERGFRAQIYQFEVLQDDHVIEPWINVPWRITTTDYGVQPVVHHSAQTEVMGSRSWDAPLADLDADFHKLRPREYAVDRQATEDRVAFLKQEFGDLLGVRIRGSHWWTMGMTIRAIDLIGLSNLMLYMFDNPDGLHRLMAFLRDDHLAYARWLEEEGLLCLNNENDYLGSGSIGYTHDLPQTDSAKVMMKDQWVLLESQETVGVGPKQFADFIFPYQASIAREFGKVYYGCCEPVDNRWHVLKELPHLARVSVSPWADEAVMAEACADRLVFSRKPNPTLISTRSFDEDAVRDDLRATLAVAGDCPLEIIMKDVHTLNNEPNRLPRWVQLARECIDERLADS